MHLPGALLDRARFTHDRLRTIPTTTGPNKLFTTPALIMVITTQVGVSFNMSDGINLAPGATINYKRTSSGDKQIAQVQDITTGSWQAISFGLLASLDVVCLINADPTNYVQIALDNAGANLVCRLYPGQAIPIPMDPGVSGFYAKANTSTVRLEILAANT